MPEDILDNEQQQSTLQQAEHAQKKVLQSREDEGDESGGEDVADASAGSGAGGGGR